MFAIRNQIIIFHAIKKKHSVFLYYRLVVWKKLINMIKAPINAWTHEIFSVSK